MNPVSGIPRPPTPIDEELVVVPFDNEEEVIVIPPKVDPNPLGLIEYVLPIEPFYLIPNYFSFAPKEMGQFVKFTLKDRDICVYGITEEARDKEFNDAFDGLIEPVLRNDELFAVADAFIQENPDLTHLREKRRSTEAYFKGEYTTLEFFYFLLGEEFCKRIYPKLRTYWCLKAVNVPRLRELIGYFLKVGEEDKLPDTIAYAKKLLKDFEQDKDYLLEDDFLPHLIPIVKRPLQPWPRLEMVKQELRKYFFYDNLVRDVTPEMDRLFERLEKDLSPGERERICAELEMAHTYQEQVKVVQRYGIRKWELAEREERIFLDYLSINLGESSEFLMGPLETIESSVPEEILDYLDVENYHPKPFHSPGKETLKKVMDVFIPLLPKLLAHCEKEALKNFLYELDADPKTKCPFQLLSPLKEEFAQFLALFKKHSYTMLVMDDEPFPKSEVRANNLVVLEGNARAILEKVCSAAQLLVVFRRMGRDVTLGSLPMKGVDEEQMRLIYGEDDQTVFVEKE
ncbi:MAG: hypothetical protein K1X28_06430 [Parachlamydiales bacterium]|nr:hypothetical protein [Parachlamydiales bacterium]